MKKILFVLVALMGNHWPAAQLGAQEPRRSPSKAYLFGGQSCTVFYAAYEQVALEETRGFL